SLDENTLSGTVPSSIIRLTDLTLLNLGTNKLEGTIPSAIFHLTKLALLVAAHNSINGSIPESIGSTIHLEILSIWKNSLSGSIPESIGSLTKLSSLDLSDNQFEGTVPEGIGNMKYIRKLWQGSLQQPLDRHSPHHPLSPLSPATVVPQPQQPEWLISSLDHTDVPHCMAVSGVPTLHGCEWSANAAWLYLSENNFSGPLPAALGGSKGLIFLESSGSGLTCPPDASSCVVRQINYSAFCQDCHEFCATCTSDQCELLGWALELHKLLWHV
ncbi:unnamed protein product, partial [Closterium sp. NIES-53]